jgi:NADPH-dependent 2,4-dienoyl-CoA reductase/sulfur reductase-like enzyme
VAGLNVVGGDAVFPGVVGTAVSKVCDLEIARTGLRPLDAREAHRDVAVATIESTTRAGYFPGAKPMTVLMLADRGTRRVLGAQIVGREGAAMRIDICALALWNEMTVDELVMTDLAYAPPFSSVWDPVQVAARAVVSQLD